MSKKETSVVKEAPVEPTPPKVINKWGASEAKWELDHEDSAVSIRMRSGDTIEGFLIGVDHYTLTVEQDGFYKPDGTPTKKTIIIFKHAIDSMT